ncbi:MAG: ethanolamine ammonia-lyase subunit EutC [Thermacetogeniaceae bacterium]
MDEKQIAALVDEVIRELEGRSKEKQCTNKFSESDRPRVRGRYFVRGVYSYGNLKEMIGRFTPARLGVGRCGPRPLTSELLSFREDHAAAQDAVFLRVNPELVSRLGLLHLRSNVTDIDVHLTRPDLGRRLSKESEEILSTKGILEPQVQLIVADGLSSTAVEANVPELLPFLQESLKKKGIKLGTPVFVEFGRVGVMDHIGEIVKAESAILLIGERPGLTTAESLSAYLEYEPRLGKTDADRIVISNIHKNGLPPAEAGAEILELIQKILAEKRSGVSAKS